MKDERNALVDRIYDAALDDSRWRGCLQAFAEIVESLPCTDIWMQHPGSADVFFESSTAVEEMSRAYFEHFAATLPEAFWNPPFTARQVVGMDRYWPGDGYWRSEYYNDFAVPFDIPHCVTMLVERAAYGDLRLCLCRGARQGPFPERTVGLVGWFLPHLARAFELRYRIASVREEAEAKAKALDSLPFGVMFLDRRGRVLDLNHAARDLVAAADGLGLDAGGILRAANAAASRSLAALLARNCDRGDDGYLDSGGRIELPRPSGARPYDLLLCPLTSFGFDVGLGRWAAVLFIRDPDAEPQAPVERIRQVHGLSPREAEIVWALSRGKRQREIADELGISLDTLRTYLKRALAKTGVRRQTELVNQVLTGPALLNGTDQLS